MKNLLKQLLQKILFILAKQILNKYNPKVIGITGSIGKSSAKEAIFAVIKNNWRVRTNIKNYNNEIGLPLTIIGEPSAGTDLWGWVKIFLEAVRLIAINDKTYPEILILEMGIDRPGDMKYLIDLVPADIGVVTNISAVHLEFFKTIERIAKEKSQLISRLKPGGWGVLNIDNQQVAKMKDEVNGRFVTYGFGTEAKVKATDVDLSYRGDKIAGISFKMSYGGAVVPVFLPNILADHLVNAALAAAGVAVILKMNLVEIGEALRNFVPPLGRMHLLAGVNGSQLIDDTYNGSPEATVAAIKVLGKIETTGRKIAVIGDMLELGDYEIAGHQLVGKAVIDSSIDVLVVVGERAKIIGRTAGDTGMKNILNFDTSNEAGEYLWKFVKAGDMVLIKGSQGMRMERATKILLAEPERAKELLVRQDEGWLEK